MDKINEMVEKHRNVAEFLGGPQDGRIMAINGDRFPDEIYFAESTPPVWYWGKEAETLDAVVDNPSNRHTYKATYTYRHNCHVYTYAPKAATV